MNLARRSILGLLKYPETLTNLHTKNMPVLPENLRRLKSREWHPPKGIYQDDQRILDWVLAPLSEQDRMQFQQTKVLDNQHNKTLRKSFDCSIMELADDIAYGIHDMEDAIFTGVVSQQEFEEHVHKKLIEIDHPWLQELTKTLTANLFSEHHYKQKEAIGGLVNFLITSVTIVDLNETDGCCFDESLLRYNAKLPGGAQEALNIFKGFVFQYVIRRTDMQRKEYRGQQIVMELFEAFANDPERLLPKKEVKNWQFACEHNQNPLRVIADYVSSMTDDYATNLYRSLFLPD